MAVDRDHAVAFGDAPAGVLVGRELKPAHALP
jgi:hypothetical protein